MTRLTRKQRITDRAHKKWERAGKPFGRDKEFWLAAESEIDAEIAKEDMRRVRPCKRKQTEQVNDASKQASGVSSGGKENA